MIKLFAWKTLAAIGVVGVIGIVAAQPPQDGQRRQGRGGFEEGQRGQRDRGPQDGGPGGFGGGFGGPGDRGPDSRGGGGRGPGGPGGDQPDREILEKFDTDKSGWLNKQERSEAREFLKSDSGQQGGGRGFGGPGGGPGGRRGGPGGGPGGRGQREAGKPGPKVSPDEVAAVEGPLYDRSAVPTIFLEFENTDWEKELEDFHGTDVDVAAEMMVDGKTYPNVGVRFRGKSSYGMVPTGSKRSFNVSLDLADEDQRLYGYKTLNLLNSNGDASMMSTVLYSEIANQFIPAPKSNHVRVVVNGESWGVYVNVQQFDKTFLKEHYNPSKGTRWKVSGSPNGDGGLRYMGEELDQYKAKYEMKSSDGKKAWTALIKLCRTLNETPLDQLEAKLDPMLDIDATLKFLALDVALVNSDGYWTRASDYSIFLDEDGKFHLVPHDMNEAFQSGGGGGPGGGGPGGGGPGGFGPPGEGGPGGFGPRFGGPGFRGPGGGGPATGGPPGGFGGPGFGGPPGEGGPRQGGPGFGPRPEGPGSEQDSRRGRRPELDGGGKVQDRGQDNRTERGDREQRGGRGERSGRDFGPQEGRGGPGGFGGGLGQGGPGQGERGQGERGRGQQGRGGPGGGRGGGGPGHGGVDLDPLVSIDNPRMALRTRLLAIPKLRAQYLNYVQQIAEKSLNWDTIGSLVTDQAALIREHVAADTRKLTSTEAFEAATDPKKAEANSEEPSRSLRSFFDQRREFLLNYKPAAPQAGR